MNDPGLKKTEHNKLKYQRRSLFPLPQWDTLLSNIGGSLGLFVGVSLISILEMFEMIIDIIFVGYKRCMRGDKRISQMSTTGEAVRFR